MDHKKRTRRGQKIKNKMKKFNVMYLNIRGMKSKYNSLLTKIEEEDPTMFCIAETHLIEEEEIKVDGYEIYRNDRNNDGWGGVLIGLKSELEHITTVVEKGKEVGETLWIVINNSKINLRVGIVYAPQESRTPKEKLKIMYEKLEEQIVQAKAKEQKLFIVGDFNCKIGDVIVGNRKEVTKGGRLLLKMMKRQKLSVLNSSEKCQGLWTRVEGNSKSVIDYMIVDKDDEKALQEMIIDEQREYAPCGQDGTMSDHNVIRSKFDWIITVEQQKRDRTVITQKGYGKIRGEMEKCSISNIIDDGELQNSYNDWKSRVDNIIRRNTTTLKRKNPRKPIKVLIKEKKKMKDVLKKMNKDGREAMIGKIKMIDQQISIENQTQYRNKMDKVVKELQGKSGVKGPNVWKVLEKVRRRNIEPPTAIKDKDGNLLEDASKIKERYLEHFLDILQPPKAESEEELKQEEIINMAFANIMEIADKETSLTTIEEVEEAINELKTGKCKDGSGWNNEIIINGGKEMKTSIHKMINRMETEKKVPTQWNEVVVKTVPKPGSVVEMDNKRGLFITEVISKIYEKIIKNRNETKINAYISKFQAGGVKQRSSVDHHIVLSEVIRKNKKLGKKTYVVYGDAVKCFDKLWLKDTLVELYKAGCATQDIQMIYNMNKDTVFSVKTPSGQTDKVSIGEVVKQGTILGPPTLCCVETDKINDVGEDQERSIDGGVIGILVFVDDVMSVGTAEDARKCIRNLHIMEILKKFTYGLKKTKFMVINTGKEDTEEIWEQVKEGHVEECEIYKYLGLWISQQGNCLIHIKKKSEKIKGEIAAIKALANFNNMGPSFIKVRLHLYEICIIPSLLFNLEGWNKLGKSEVKKLESAQAKSLCTLLEIPKSTPYLGLLNELGIWTIEERLKYRKISLYHNIINSDDSRLTKSLIIEQSKMSDIDTFYADTCGMASSLKIKLTDIENLSKHQLQKLLRSNIDTNMADLVSKSLGFRKMRFVKKPDRFMRKDYVDLMNGYDTIQAIKIRLNMIEIYGNFKHNLTLPRLCPYCNEVDDTTEHLVTCRVLGVGNVSPHDFINEDNCGLWTRVLEVVRFNLNNRGGTVPIKL